MKSPRPSLRHLLGRSWRFDLTSGGRTLVAAILISGVAGSVTVMVPVYCIFIAMLILYMAAGSISLILRPRLRIEGPLPARAAAGQRLQARLTVVNESPHRRAFDVGLGLFNLPKSLRQLNHADSIASLSCGQGGALTVDLMALRRGQYDLGALTAYSTFPFNLVRRMGGSRAAGRLTVVPSFTPLERLELSMTQRHQPGGIAFSSRVGESPEYFGSRDFRPGDSTRHIDFRSWARLAAPAVKEFQEEYYSRVALVLDTYMPHPRRLSRRRSEALEAAVSLTAAAAEVLSRGEYIVDIFAAGPQLYTFRTGRHTTAFDNILEVLACVGPCRGNPFIKLTPELAGILPNVSAMVCVLLDWDRPRLELIRSAAQSGCSVKVALVSDRGTPPELAGSEPWMASVRVCTSQDVREGRVLSL
ncbi:MAG: DUF58 domain-containing protein [Planctomycetaceae bacterium]|nr:DUF58 domain-containing protein [Planctomycetaceae bacterium]